MWQRIPYQGLKLESLYCHISVPYTGKKLKPYQGLKPQLNVFTRDRVCDL
jgi:hypothetical protein